MELGVGYPAGSADANTTSSLPGDMGWTESTDVGEGDTMVDVPRVAWSVAPEPDRGPGPEYRCVKSTSGGRTPPRRSRGKGRSSPSVVSGGESEVDEAACSAACVDVH